MLRDTTFDYALDDIIGWLGELHPETTVGKPGCTTECLIAEFAVSKGICRPSVSPETSGKGMMSYFASEPEETRPRPDVCVAPLPSELNQLALAFDRDFNHSFKVTARQVLGWAQRKREEFR